MCRGTNQILSKHPPVHIRDNEDFEPLFAPEDKILEDSLRREADRVSHQENVMNRVVYDCVDPSPYNPVRISGNTFLLGGSSSRSGWRIAYLLSSNS